MTKFTKEQREYVGKFLGDMAKIIAASGLASKLFTGMPTELRIGLPFMSLLFLACCLWFLKKEKGEENG